MVSKHSGKNWILRSSKLGQKFPQTDKCLEAHHTNERQNCSAHSSGCISVSNNVNLKYMNLLHSKSCKSNRETHKYGAINFKQSNFWFNSPNFLRKSSLIQLCTWPSKYLTLFFLSCSSLQWSSGSWHQQFQSPSRRMGEYWDKSSATWSLHQEGNYALLGT